MSITTLALSSVNSRTRLLTLSRMGGVTTLCILRIGDGTQGKITQTTLRGRDSLNPRKVMTEKYYLNFKITLK
jgi:hypothetical protein